MLLYVQSEQGMEEKRNTHLSEFNATQWPYKEFTMITYSQAYITIIF